MKVIHFHWCLLVSWVLKRNKLWNHPGEIGPWDLTQTSFSNGVWEMVITRDLGEVHRPQCVLNLNVSILLKCCRPNSHTSPLSAPLIPYSFFTFMPWSACGPCGSALVLNLPRKGSIYCCLKPSNATLSRFFSVNIQEQKWRAPAKD